MSPFLNADVLTRLGPGDAGRFAREGYLPLPGLLTDDGLAALGREAVGLEAVAQRRDFAMACMDDSPRRMTTLRGRVISETSEPIPALCRDRNLIGPVRRAAGEPVIEVEDPVERHVLNIPHRAGDTHGAHTDDHPYALVLFLEAPDDPAYGGLVHFPRAASRRNLASRPCTVRACAVPS
ncbi:hypothetical protein [Streptomyces sp. NRRL F-5727]|uniref:HalD/BesD family halogenase n=1 Tax=Streptomyces sp. NRRL F-5727 TaxID=1463871 RepID=UPI0004C85B1F|nr:hypothetical protein [Streptomyces sp. NRRL F-5727]